MFGISLPELTVVLILVLIVVGPERLPEVARTLGRWFGEFRKTSNEIRRDFYNAIYEPAQEVDRQVKRELESVKGSFANSEALLSQSSIDTAECCPEDSKRAKECNQGDKDTE